MNDHLGLQGYLGQGFRLALFAVALTSCVPLLTTTRVAPPILGKVISEKTGQPVAGARVTATRHRGRYHVTGLSQSDGSFKLPALTQWHYMWVFGRGLVPKPYFHNYKGGPPIDLSVWKGGYALFRKAIACRNLRFSDDDLLQLSDIAIKPAIVSPKALP